MTQEKASESDQFSLHHQPNWQVTSGVALGVSLLAGATFFLHPFVSESSYAANTDVSVSYAGEDWNISAPTSTAADAGGLKFEIEGNPAGVSVAKKDTVTGGGTNVPNYQIYVSVNSEGGKIPATSGDSAIAATSGTSATPAALGSNSWGYALATFEDTINYDDLVSSSKSDSWSNSKWAKLPYVSDSNLEDSSKTSTDAAKIYDSTTDTGDSVDVYYAVNADNDLASGEYQTTVTYTLIGEMPTPAKSYMQDMDSATCQSLEEFDATNDTTIANTTYTFYDSRDESDYAIRRLKDGHCWMAQNFRMTADTLSANSHSTTLTSADTNLTNSYTMPSNAAFSNSAGATTEGAVDATKVPKGSKTGAKASGEEAIAHGAYYSWATAVANKNSIGTSSKQTSSICPKGWKLPDSDGSTSTSTNQWQALYSAYGTAASFNQAFNTYYSSSSATNYLAGVWWSDSDQYVDYVGSDGYWWSSTSHSSGANFAWYLNANTSSVTPSYYNNRYHGYSVRCML